MRKFLALILLTIFTVQILPLRAIGKLLTSGQNTEEVQQSNGEDIPDENAVKFDDNIVYHHHAFDIVANTLAFNNKVSVFIHKAESLPSVHIAQLLSPPPDRC